LDFDLDVDRQLGLTQRCWRRVCLGWLPPLRCRLAAVGLAPVPRTSVPGQTTTPRAAVPSVVAPEQPHAQTDEQPWPAPADYPGRARKQRGDDREKQHDDDHDGD